MPRTYATGKGGSPGGSNTDVQFNDSGNFGGNGDFTFDGTNVTISPGKLNVSEIDTPSSSNPSIDVANARLKDSSGVLSEDWSIRRLYNSSGSVPVIDYSSSLLNDSSSTQSINWDGRQAFDSTTKNSILWGVRQLIASDGTTVVLDWSSTTPIFHGQFSDNETPSGLINSSNKVFTLANSPSPSASLQLIYNGQFQLFGTDYTLAASTITFASAPITGTWLRAYYRH